MFVAIYSFKAKFGYAQWPSRSVWEENGNPVDTPARRRWMAACESFETRHCLEVLEDLLIPSRFHEVPKNAH